MESFFEPVRAQLNLVEDRLRAQAQDHHSELGAALHHLLASGGKRLRPTMTLLMAHVIGTDAEKAIILGAAVELLHTATLVHDDLIDGAMLRRGNPTLNSNWSSAATVLTGDFLFARAAKLASELDSPLALRLFSDTLATIVNGEITQLFTSRGRASRPDYYQRIYAKTASLFETAAYAIALIGPAAPETCENAKRYGYNIGMAFQIVDDILDYNGEQATMGKPVASDLRQGLVTLPALYYLESHPDDADMKMVLGTPDCDETCFDRLLTAIRQSGAIEQSAGEARQFASKALQALEVLPDHPERAALADLANYIVQRKL